ncbi:hypothetical protein SAMN05880592_10273 [Bosea sp. TND4EK4]|nr:hypothetical protein SAMN05880592_10273 [Bosea sp. TND4EK4]
MAAAPLARPAFSRRVFCLASALWPATAFAQAKKPAAAATGPSMSVARSIMAGAPLSAFLSRAPQGARLAIARPDDPADKAIVVLEPKVSVPSVQTPGVAGDYELRLMVDRDGKPAILLRRPLVVTEPLATLAAPERVGRRQALPVRGIGPNGEQDRVVLVAPDAPIDAEGPRFFPAENVEATLEAPEQPGAYELRYVLNAPVSGLRILARKPVIVE